MINPTFLMEIMMENSSLIPAIKKHDVVATDDEFVDRLGDHKAGDNILVVGIIPSYGGFGQEDESGTISYLQFFVLEKVDYKSLKNRDEYIAIFERTLEAAKLFIQKMFLQEEINCSLEKLQYDWSIRPVSRKAQCNGYEIQIDSKAFTDNY